MSAFFRDYVYNFLIDTNTRLRLNTSVYTVQTVKHFCTDQSFCEILSTPSVYLEDEHLGIEKAQKEGFLIFFICLFTVSEHF